MKKSLILLGLLVLVAAAGFAYLQYNKPHRNTDEEKAAHTLQAEQLYAAYESDEAAANNKYLDKLLLVKGVVSSINLAGDSATTLMLETEDPMFGVSCELLPGEVEKLGGLQEGDSVRVKGICTGKLMDVVLVRSVLEQKEN